MFRVSVLRRGLLRTAADAAAAAAASQEKGALMLASAAPQSAVAPTGPWHDDQAEHRAALEAHYRSEEYRQLHRPHLTNAAMGLFGGEPGFEKAHRVWVDPDRPHIKHIYNRTVLARNLFYARYGHFKRELHLIDVDKLVRHARMLPPAPRLLSDFFLARAPLDDRNCAALLRYARDTLRSLPAPQRLAERCFTETIEMFERMVTRELPPCDVGPATHAEMVRVCAVMRMYERGAEYIRRADEEAADGRFVLTADFFDACVHLARRCGRVEEGIAFFERLQAANLRALPTTLRELCLLLASPMPAPVASPAPEEQQEEQPVAKSNGKKKLKAKAKAKAKGKAETPRPELRLAPAPPTARAECATFEGRQRLLEDVRALFDFYAHPLDTASTAALIRAAAMLGRPDMALDAVAHADATGVALDSACVEWLLYALRFADGTAPFIHEFISTLSSRRGLQADHVILTVAAIAASHQRDGHLALSLLDEHTAGSSSSGAVKVTPELCLAAVQAFARCPEPTPEMLRAATDAVAAMERTGSVVDLRRDVAEALVELCARLGAVATGLGVLRRMLAVGDQPSARVFNALLRCNAAGEPPAAGTVTTEEVLQLMDALGVVASVGTLDAIAACDARFGSTAAIRAATERIADRAVAAAEEAERAAANAAASFVDADPDEPARVFDQTPKQLRRLQTRWSLNARDMILKRFGQSYRQDNTTFFDKFNPIRRPFGRAPGEKTIR